jgi:hypothetical protein
MSSLHQYLVPWMISQALSLIILFLAIRKPVWTRHLFAAGFIAAGIFNWITAVRTPGAYMTYADTAIGLYRHFIEGWFSEHIGIVIPLIASGQIIIGIFMFAGKRFLALGCLGIILFLLAIAPLGVGSAFPFSITVSVAAYLVYRDWKISQRAVNNE